MKRVLVTGGNGFVGRWSVRRLLDEGWEVHSLARKPGPEGIGETGANLKHHQGDLFTLSESDISGLFKQNRIEYLLHLAWNTEHGVFWKSPENLRWVEASLKLFRVFYESGGKRSVGAGTCAEYDWNPGGVLDENAVCTPNTLYGTSKYALFSILKEYTRTEDLNFSWGRLFFLYGPGEVRSRFIPSVIDGLLEGRNVEVKFGRHRRNFIHSQDAGRAFADLLMSDALGAVNIAGGQTLTLGEIAGMIAGYLGREDLLHVSSATTDNNPEVLIGSTERLRQETDFDFQKELEPGLIEIIENRKRELPGT